MVPIGKIRVGFILEYCTNTEDGSHVHVNKIDQNNKQALFYSKVDMNSHLIQKQTH